MDLVQSMTVLFITLLCSKVLTQLYLSYRNDNYICKKKEHVPDLFNKKISLEDHQKAATYTTTHSKFSRKFLFIDVIILLAWTLGGGLNIIDQESAKWAPESLVLRGIIVFSIFSLIGLILSLPETIYRTFVIEEKFGFNKTTKKIFCMDLVKQIILGAIIGLPILWVLLTIMVKLGHYWWAYAWGFLTLVQFLLILIYPTFIAPLFNKFTPLEEGPVKNKIEELLDRTSFSYSGLFIMDASKRSSHGNAYFTGLGKNKRIVFFDTLIKTLIPEEVEAVLAHELGHFKHKHIMKQIIVSIVSSLIGFFILGLLYRSSWFYNGMGIREASPYMALILFSFISPLVTFYITPIQAYFYRKNEFEADAFAVKYADGTKLISSLISMYKDNASFLLPDPLYSSFYFSHPPAMVRIKFIEQEIKKQNS